MAQVDLNRVPAYFHNYINQVPEKDLASAFKSHPFTLVKTLEAIPEDKWTYRYQEGKWSIKDIVQHIIDAERIFCYRALRFARFDKSPLQSFDENSYANEAGADRRSKSGLLEELVFVQKGSALLFNSFTDDQLQADGIASEKSVYVEGIGFIIVGHSLHHRKIILERYLNEKAIPA